MVDAIRDFVIYAGLILESLHGIMPLAALRRGRI